MQSAFERYPLGIIVLSNGLSILIYTLALFILYQLGIIFAILFFCYCVFLEIRLYRSGCVNCYYYGKLCGFGKGKVCSFFFSRGNPERFNEKKLTWKDMIPDMLILFIPFAGGIFSLFLSFSWIILSAVIVIIFLSLFGNAFIRGSFSCKYCKQKELGCPASELFSQTNK